MDISKSFAEKYNLPLEKIHKFNSASPRTHELVTRSYQTTKNDNARLEALQTQIQAQLKRPVGHSSIICAMIKLAARDETVRQKLLAVIEHENVYKGKIQKQLS